jgi:hypothetical protein
MREGRVTPALYSTLFCRRTILIVDDQLFFRKMLCEILQGEGFMVIAEAANGTGIKMQKNPETCSGFFFTRCYAGTFSSNPSEGILGISISCSLRDHETVMPLNSTFYRGLYALGG